MSERNQLHDFYDQHGDYGKLARWLQQLLAAPEQDTPPPETRNENGIPFEKNYHIEFYQQLPDFAMALLTNDPQTTIHYGPLLYHLLACPACHGAYLEIYDALHFALAQGEESRSIVGTRPLGPASPSMLVHVSKLLISQAEFILRRARHEDTNQDATARSLLQLAMKFSSQLTQSTLRNQALHDLVRVATLFDTSEEALGYGPADYSFSPTLAGAGVRGGKVMRRAEPRVRQSETEQPAIYLQSGPVEGRITQQGDTLELYLHDLKVHLRGQHVTISVPLGSLIEPVRWLGGNPLSIRSTVPVDAQGHLTMPLGHTDLRLSNPEERSLLEVMFLHLNVRPT